LKSLNLFFKSDPTIQEPEIVDDKSN
jgi:hypothetical protein